MSGIRVTYSGLIGFAILISSVFTGFVFTGILTRTLTPEEFGTWNLVSGLLIYGFILEPIVSYWPTREAARGIESGKTSIIFGGIFSVGGIVIYLITVLFFNQQLPVDQNILLFAVILIPITFLNKILNAINAGWKPQVTSYGYLLIEIIKIPAVLILVYPLDFGVIGVILAIAIAQVGNIIFQTIHALPKIKNKIQKEFYKKWIKFSWIPLHSAVVNTLLTRSDVLIFTMITQSLVGLAFYSVAIAIGSITSNSVSITSNTYSKLLEGGKWNYLQDNFTRMVYFSIPLAALSLTFAKPGVFLLNPIYETASSIIIFITIRIFFRNFSLAFDTYLTGAEKTDANSESTTKDYMKSMIILVSNIRAAYYITYLILLASGLYLLKNYTTNPLDFIVYWSVIALISEIPCSVHLYIIVRKRFGLKFDFRSIYKYLAVGIGIFGIIYVLMNQFIEYKNNIFEFLPTVLFWAGLGIMSYFIITYFVDLKTKKLFNAIIHEIRNKM